MTRLVLGLTGADDFARDLAAALSCGYEMVDLHRFPDGENLVRIDADLQGRSVILAAALDRPDDKVLPLIFTAELARELGASVVGLAAPYLPYMRQDKRFRPGEAITSVSFARLLSQRLDFLVTVEPHLHRWRDLRDIYDIPAIAVSAAGPMAEWIRARVTNPVLVGPDAESAQWVARIAGQLGAPWTVLAKMRRGDLDVSVTHADLPETSAVPVIIDDIVSSGRTVLAAAQALRESGRPAELCVCAHALMNNDAVTLLARAGIRIVSCDTVQHPSNEISVTAAVAESLTNLKLP